MEAMAAVTMDWPAVEDNLPRTFQLIWPVLHPRTG